MKIIEADKQQAATIAQLIMTAMTDDCCLYYAGPSHTLADFHDMMTKLVEMDNSQYSYKNTLLAIDESERVMGVCVSYDGALLHLLREQFVSAAKVHFGRDFSNIDDETQEGELYIDSLAVFPEFRGKGVATALLKASISKAKKLNIPTIGLLVDKGNPNAERLYRGIGFEYSNDTSWGGHPMKHLIYNTEKI